MPPVVQAQRYSHNFVEANYEAGTIDHDRELAAQRRQANLEAKMCKAPSDGGHFHCVIGTTAPIHELQAIRSAQGIGSPSQQAIAYCTVYYKCRRSDCTKQVDQMLGTGVISFPETNTLLGMSYLANHSNAFSPNNDPQHCGVRL